MTSLIELLKCKLLQKLLTATDISVAFYNFYNILSQRFFMREKIHWGSCNIYNQIVIVEKNNDAIDVGYYAYRISIDLFRQNTS